MNGVRPDTGFAARTYAAQDGLRLYYRDYAAGEERGPPILCLPGITRNSKDYHNLAARLSVRRRVLCPDYRGRGLSARDPRWRNYEARRYVDDLRHLLAVAGVHRVVVIGTSLGGILAMALAVAQPTALAGVIINDIGPDVAANGLGRILGYIGSDRPQRDWDEAVVEMRRLFPDWPGKTPAEWEEFARSTYRLGEDGLLHFDWDVALARPLARAGRPPDLWPLFRALRRLPVLALRGARSDVLTPQTFARMAAEHARLTAVEIPDVGHVPRLLEPAAAAAIDDYLDRL